MRKHLALVASLAPILVVLVSMGIYLGKQSQGVIKLENDVKELQKNLGELKSDIQEAPSSGETVQQRHVPTPGQEIRFSNSGGFGKWSDPVFCPPGYYVCGLRQKVEGNQGSGDDTSMNAVSFYCCPLPSTPIS